jgi:histone H3/H4
VVVAPPARQAPASGASASAASADVPRDVLVVVSKLKAYVKARSGMNTSDGVVEELSDHLRKICDDAVRVAGNDGRKTVMDRDFRAVFRALYNDD